MMKKGKKKSKNKVKKDKKILIFNQISKLKPKVASLVEKVKANKWTIICTIITIVISIIGLLLSKKAIDITQEVRQDTAELTKLTEKPIYYKIKIYPTQDTGKYREEENYINWNLQLTVDDFEVHKEDFLDVNYNSTFSHITYYMVYDYDIQNTNKYYYKHEALEDRIQAKMRLEDDLYMNATSMNYSLTPNKQYCYILIHTETLSEQNLDLVFFKYNKDSANKLEFIQVEDTVQLDITDVRKEHLISRDYYSSTWSKTQEEYEDINFMFDVYEDLKDKIREQL